MAARLEQAPGHARGMRLHPGRIFVQRLTLFVVGSVTLSLLAVILAACGGATKTTASSSPSASTAVVTTLAGKAGSRGSADGSGTAARFNFPTGIAVDAAGNLYVADWATTPSARSPPPGWSRPWPARPAPRAAPTARRAAASTTPAGIACDAAGNLYVADSGNNTIRKITPAGMVRPWPARPASRAAPTAAAPRRASTTPTASPRRRRQPLRRRPARQPRHPQDHAAGMVTTLAGQAGVAGQRRRQRQRGRFNDARGHRLRRRRQPLRRRHRQQHDPQDHAEPLRRLQTPPRVSVRSGGALLHVANTSPAISPPPLPASPGWRASRCPA